MTNDLLSGDANRLVDLVRRGETGVRELIASYDAWRSDDNPPSDEASGGLAGRMLSDVRAQFGIASGMAGELEACGDALRILAAEADGDVRSAWHDTKLRAVGGSDRDKKLLAMRHLDESDYEDYALLAGLIDSLTRDEQRIAMTFGMTSAMNIDPSRHENAIRLLFGEMAELERRGQSRAANFATTIEQAFAEHPVAVVPSWLIDEWARVVGDVEDPSSFAALIDLWAVAILRSHDVSTLEQWLRSENAEARMLAVAVIKNIGVETLSAAEWIEPAIREELARRG
ncbi:MAG: hypothetical protein QOC81_1683 [Thermoanaerobaculia bacterium]|jgi:hypothetical protein|nr:hypothetical protein [Thermoanaerobaculia bacterium]